jgi:hypothetical protein
VPAVHDMAHRKHGARTMADIGHGYGSEWHLLRYLGRHRADLAASVRGATGGDPVEWLDFPFNTSSRFRDGEWKGLDFLKPNSPARVAWLSFWPSRGTPPSWDAIGQATIGDTRAWLLVEAKAHTGELRSDCGAREEGGRPKIRAAFDRVKAALGVPDEAAWLDGFYQHANRIAVLWHLIEHGEPGHLINVHFTGDVFPSGNFDCPADEAKWRGALDGREAHLGLPPHHPLSDRIHSLFLPTGKAAN